MRIAVLGTGPVATTLTTGLLRAGHDVVLGSRTPGAKADLPAPVATRAEAIEGSDLVVSALAGPVALGELAALRTELAGHVLLDLGNAVDETFELLYPETSLGQRIAAALPDTRVVKSLNTLGLDITIDPSALSAPTDVFLSGDDAQAKALVSGVLVDLGWPTGQQIDLGPLATARAVEHYFYLFATLMQQGGPRFNIAVVR